MINVSDLHRYLGCHQSSCSVTTTELFHKIFRRRFWTLYSWSKGQENLFLVIFLGCGVECSKRDLKNSWIRPILIPYRCYNKKRVTKVFVYTRRRLSPKLKREVGIFQKGKIRQDFATREIQIKVHVTCVTSPPIHLLPSQNVLWKVQFHTKNYNVTDEHIWFPWSLNLTSLSTASSITSWILMWWSL